MLYDIFINRKKSLRNFQFVIVIGNGILFLLLWHPSSSCETSKRKELEAESGNSHSLTKFSSLISGFCFVAVMYLHPLLTWWSSALHSCQCFRPAYYRSILLQLMTSHAQEKELVGISCILGSLCCVKTQYTIYTKKAKR